MKRLRRIWRFAAAISLAAWIFPASSLGVSQAEKSRAAAGIIHDALQREAKQEIDDRVALIRPALEMLPTHPEALWHTGFVFDRLSEQWLRFDEVAQFCGKDDRLQAYRKVRGNYPQTVAGQRELARWCAQRKLDDQARAHLTQVLERDPDHAAARRELGYRWVNGTWVSEPDLAAAEAHARKTVEDTKVWKPRLEKLYEGLTHPSPQRREQAQQEFLAIRDPGVIGAIEVVFCAKGGDAALAGIEALRNISSSEGAAALAWHAVFSPWEPVRQAAAMALQSQDKHDYVPLLLGAMQSPIQSRVEIYQRTAGNVADGLLYRHMFYREGMEARELAVLDDAFQHVFTTRTVRTVARTNRDQGAGRLESAVRDMQMRRQTMEIARRQAEAKAAERETAVARHNLAVDALNARVGWALGQATGEYRPYTPQQWQEWWYDYNEVVSEGERPLRRYYQYETDLRVSQLTPMQTSHSCFAAGTPVWTESGPVPVQDVRVGDRVFACNPETGCLDLKAVLKTTINPQAETLTLQIGGKTIAATGGHVFWVSGTGWAKFRDLKPGMRLHTMQGTVEVQSVEPATEQPTYNLIVADFHTYFAGEARILTHDITIRRPTNCIVPGLAVAAP
ncbi:MAG: hypothetical protein GXY83_02435 [Rhodopirellula sp.]|nr:hypothetical protein [Rhodopirellula sp.]